MKVLGLKLTHDGSISIAEGNDLVITYELEKFKNNNRYKILSSLDDLSELLNICDHDLNDFDKIVVDGWIGEKSGLISVFNGREYKIPAP